jgi:DegV family protein with EDD domain
MADTTVQMTQEMADAHDISLIPLYVIIDDKSYTENQVDLDQFYEMIAKWRKDGLPATSGPSAGDFLEAYRELSRRTETVLYISLISKFSTTFNSAMQAKKMAERESPHIPFEIIDTLTVCGAQMLIAIETSRAVAEGGNLHEVINIARNMIKRVNCFSLSHDLYYLAKGGRIHKGHAWAGSQVTNTVILEADYTTGGVNRPLGRYKTKKQAVRTLIEIVKVRSANQRLHVAINHADAVDEAEWIKERVLSKFQCAEVYITPILPLVTAHNGLGTLKFNWWDEA